MLATENRIEAAFQGNLANTFEPHVNLASFCLAANAQRVNVCPLFKDQPQNKGFWQHRSDRISSMQGSQNFCTYFGFFSTVFLVPVHLSESIQKGGNALRRTSYSGLRLRPQIDQLQKGTEMLSSFFYQIIKNLRAQKSAISGFKR